MQLASIRLWLRVNEYTALIKDQSQADLHACVDVQFLEATEFERFDYFVLPTAQLFPFDANVHWPQEIAGRRMETYHEWMKGVLPITMSGGPALAAPAGFKDLDLPIGIQIVGPNRFELSCLQLGYAYDTATAWPSRRSPRLLNES